jgi:RND superfamily putative drug exporter
MRQIARFCYRRRRYVVAGWIAALVAILALSSAFAGEFSTEFKLPGSESQDALDLLERSGVNERAGVQGQVIFEAQQDVEDPAVRESIEGLLSKIDSGVEGVEVVSPYEEGKEYQVAEGGKIAYAELNFSDRSWEEYTNAGDAIEEMRDGVDVQGLRVELGGEMFANAPQFSSEFIGILAAIVILLIAFGSVIAMGLPIITALFGIGCGTALVALFTRVMAIPEGSTQIAAMVGIGVGIDYALLMVSRYRDGLRDGLDPEQSVTLSLDTSGRAVLFAGLTVVISLLGMFMMDLDAMRGVSISAIFAVLMTMSAALTLLPALLGFAGKNIDRFGLPHRKDKPGEIHRSFWWRWSRVIQTHPWACPRREHGAPGPAGRPAAIATARVRRRRQPAGIGHQPPGIRPLLRGIRAGLQLPDHGDRPGRRWPAGFRRTRGPGWPPRVHRGSRLRDGAADAG